MPELIKNVTKKIYDFWFAKESTLSLGVFRIVFGLFIFKILLLSYFHWNEYYGVNGIIFLDRFINARGGCFLASFKSIFALSNNPQFIWVIYGLGLVVTLCFILGLGTRIAFIYPFSAIDKLYSDIAWREGSIMYYISLYDAWFRFTDVELSHNYFLSLITTYSSLILKFLFPILVWFKWTKYWILSIMVLFHISIAIVMNEFVLQFSVVMLISYTLFVESETIKKLLYKFKSKYYFVSQKLVMQNKVNS